MINDFWVEVLEGAEVGFEVEWFRVSAEAACGFEDYKVVNVRVEFMQTDLEPVELSVYEEEIVDFAAVGAVDVDW